MPDKVVSIGFLTEQDLRKLGDGFSRHFPIESDDHFADLMAKLDQIPYHHSPKARSSQTRR
ncbi:hypothetical protein [Sphingobium sp. KCTC 72723]|uniref:hypothetical protein n=1 Tax=Sphingobium sp. KCTC 72723 TaxID=2733867 RepID=UPI00165E1538|nr:hypothetical protein [Sphingobium sp. KCTC 72723]